MTTRSKAAKAASQGVPNQEEQPAPQQVLDQPLRPDARTMREMAQNSILNLEVRIAGFEAKEEWTEPDGQSVLRISRMLENLCGEFKEYHFVVVAGIESEQDLGLEQVVFNEHQNKTMDLIDRIGNLLQKRTPSGSAPSSKNDRLIDRQLDSLEGSVREIRRGVGTPGIGKNLLTNYQLKITGLEGELRVLKKEILSLDDYRERQDRATDECDLFDLV